MVRKMTVCTAATVGILVETDLNNFTWGFSSCKDQLIGPRIHVLDTSYGLYPHLRLRLVFLLTTGLSAKLSRRREGLYSHVHQK